jgi:cytochrome c oxidase assembly factor CtaG
MDNNMQTPADKDPKLWEIARKRAAFRKSLGTYFIVNAFLWALWFITYGRNHNDHWPWPIWPMLGWGIGLVFQYFAAYVNPAETSTEEEYEKLKRKQQNK